MMLELYKEQDNAVQLVCLMYNIYSHTREHTLACYMTAVHSFTSLSMLYYDVGIV